MNRQQFAARKNIYAVKNSADSVQDAWAGQQARMPLPESSTNLEDASNSGSHIFTGEPKAVFL
jgi:hypothetical protein